MPPAGNCYDGLAGGDLYHIDHSSRCTDAAIRSTLLDEYLSQRDSIIGRTNSSLTDILPFDPKAFLSVVGAGRTLAKYRKNQRVFSQGATADSIFYIQKGRIKVTVISERGKEAVVAILGNDEFCGEGCLSGQPRRMATATAMAESEIMRIEKAALTRVLHEEPAFSELFVAHLLARTIRVEEDLVDQLFNSSEKRLARALLLLANFGKEGKPEPVITKVSQETLADMIGTTRARVSYFMNKFRRLGFISYNGKLEVHSSLLSVVLYDQPHIKATEKQIQRAKTAPKRKTGR